MTLQMQPFTKAVETNMAPTQIISLFSDYLTTSLSVEGDFTDQEINEINKSLEDIKNNRFKLFSNAKSAIKYLRE